MKWVLKAKITALPFTLMSLLHSEFIFVYSVKKGSDFFLDIQLTQHHLKFILPSFSTVLHLAWSVQRTLVSRLFTVLRRSVDLPWYGEHAVLINTAEEVLASDRASPYTLLQECPAYFYPLYSGMNFTISLPSSTRKPTRILKEIQKSQVYKFINHLEEYFIFILLNRLNHDILLI